MARSSFSWTEAPRARRRRWALALATFATLATASEARAAEGEVAEAEDADEAEADVPRVGVELALGGTASVGTFHNEWFAPPEDGGQRKVLNQTHLAFGIHVGARLRVALTERDFVGLETHVTIGELSWADPPVRGDAFRTTFDARVYVSYERALTPRGPLRLLGGGGLALLSLGGGHSQLSEPYRGYPWWFGSLGPAGYVGLGYDPFPRDRTSLGLAAKVHGGYFTAYGATAVPVTLSLDATLRF